MTLHGGEPFDISTSSLADYFFSESIADGIHTFLTTKGRYFITLTFIFYTFQYIALLLHANEVIAGISYILCMIFLLPYYFVMYIDLMKMAFSQFDVLYIVMCIFVSNSSELYMAVSAGSNLAMTIITCSLQIPALFLFMLFDCIPHAVFPLYLRRYFSIGAAILVSIFWVWQLIMSWNKKVETTIFNRRIVVSDLYISSFGTFCVFCIKVAMCSIFDSGSLTILNRNISYASLKSRTLFNVNNVSSTRSAYGDIT